MKSINVYFEDNDYIKVKKLKKDRSWRELIIMLVDFFNEVKEDVKE